MWVIGRDHRIDTRNCSEVLIREVRKFRRRKADDTEFIRAHHEARLIKNATSLRRDVRRCIRPCDTGSTGVLDRITITHATLRIECDGQVIRIEIAIVWIDDECEEVYVWTISNGIVKERNFYQDLG